MKETVLLHLCCAPCGLHPIKELSRNYDVVAFFFNPNIYPPSEHNLRLSEARDICRKEDIRLIAPELHRGMWLDITKSYGDEREGGHRCSICFEYRLQKTAECAIDNGIKLFTTTLTTGPNKPGKVIFPIANRIADLYGITFLEFDFKKRMDSRSRVFCQKLPVCIGRTTVDANIPTEIAASGFPPG